MTKKLMYVSILLLFFGIKQSALFTFGVQSAAVEWYGEGGEKDLPDEGEKRVQFEFSDDFLHEPLNRLHCVFVTEKVYVGDFTLAAAPFISLPYPPPDTEA